MKEKPILFSAPMVRAILNDSKTQTRRVVKPQPEMVENKITKPWRGNPEKLLRLLQEAERCPYEIGMKLWVRETFGSINNERDPVKPYEGCGIIYRADIPDDCGDSEDTWRPSIFMPRWASRIDLEVTGVRVERVQEISGLDCIAEGIHPIGPEHDTAIPRKEYQALWDSLNAPRGYGWDKNPFVWVIEFKHLKGA